MSELLALSVSVAVLGGIWAFMRSALWPASLLFGLGSSRQAASLLRVAIGGAH